MAGLRASHWFGFVALSLGVTSAFAEHNLLTTDILAPAALPAEFDLGDDPDTAADKGFFQIQFGFENAAGRGDASEFGALPADRAASWTGQRVGEGLDSALRAAPPWESAGSVALQPTGIAAADDGEVDPGPIRLRGGIGLDWGRDRIAIPLTHQQARVDNGRYRRYDALGLTWQRRLDANNLVSLSAEFGDFVSLDAGARDTASTAAALGWKGEFAGTTRPQLSGSIYLGDEVPKDEALRVFGRRYYGFVLDGRFTPIQNHTPYASLRFQRSDYEADDPGALNPRREDYSQLAAGWAWQVMPNWGLRAEAHYSLNDSNLDAYEYDRMQFFFTTRFDFR
ncbi:MAG TPA: hypothetical protein VGA00_13825 [Acidiferrobacterales bacterium]